MLTSSEYNPNLNTPEVHANVLNWLAQYLRERSLSQVFQFAFSSNKNFTFNLPNVNAYVIRVAPNGYYFINSPAVQIPNFEVGFIRAKLSESLLGAFNTTVYRLTATSLADGKLVKAVIVAERPKLNNCLSYVIPMGAVDFKNM